MVKPLAQLHLLSVFVLSKSSLLNCWKPLHEGIRFLFALQKFSLIVTVVETAAGHRTLSD